MALLHEAQGYNWKSLKHKNIDLIEKALVSRFKQDIYKYNKHVEFKRT